MAKAFKGRWRISEMDVWDNDYLDLVEPAHIGSRARMTVHSASEPSRVGSTFVTGHETAPHAPSSPGKA
jgi:hypothetical protein